MNETVTIFNKQIIAKEYKGQRVVTFKDIDLVHGRPDGTAKRNFNENKYEGDGKTERFIKGVDYFEISKREVGTNFVQSFGFDKFAPNGILITESGYLMLVKSFTDDLAWKVQRELINNYFKLQEIKENIIENMASNNKMEQLKLEKEGFKLAVDILKPSQASTVKMLKGFNESQGLTTAYLPNYVDEQEGHSATELLKKYSIPLTIIRFNKLMIQYGYLEECTRKSTNAKGFKHYKKLTEKGLSYGKNVISSRGTEKETQPLYYENTFQDLINILG